MKKLFQFLGLGLGFGIVAMVLGTAPGGGTASADHVAPVTITGPLPVPVSGSVNASQSGTWNVGINGTPSVNVSSLPAVTLGGSSSVSVNSSSSTPIFVDVDGPWRHPYQSTCANGASTGDTGNGCFLTTVPNGVRLVIDSISMNAAVPSGVKLVNMQFSAVSGSDTLFFGPLSSENATDNEYSFSQRVSFYLEAGARPVCKAFFDGTLNAGNGFTCEVTGHLVVLP